MFANHYIIKGFGITAGGILVVLTFSFLLTRGGDSRPVLGMAGPPGDRTAMVIHDLTFIRTQGNHADWSIQASRAKVLDAFKAVSLQDLTVRFDPADSGWGLEVRGRQGELDTQTHDFKLSGGPEAVEMRTADGLRLITPSLRWTDRSQTLHSVDHVEIQGRGFTIRGTGLEADLGTQQLRVLADVQAVLF